MVESYYGPVEYLPDGRKLAIMSGQSGSGMYFPLPGGAKAFDLNGTWLEVHADWLGSAPLTASSARASRYSAPGKAEGQ